MNGIGEKFGESDFQEKILSHDIIALLETQKDEKYDIDFPGYQSYHFASQYRHRNARKATGGFLVLVANAYARYINISRENDFLKWIRLRSELIPLNSDLNIGVVYIPPTVVLILVKMLTLLKRCITQ